MTVEDTENGDVIRPTPIRLILHREHRARPVHRIRRRMVLIQPLRTHHKHRTLEPKVIPPILIHRTCITDTDIALTDAPDHRHRHRTHRIHLHPTIHSTSDGNCIF